MHATVHSGAPERAARTRILVVEDDTIVARDIETTLQGMDYEVVDLIRRGEWVGTALQEHEPDLVLMDIRLAGDVDGVDAAENAREEYDVPVIFLTGYADQETLDRASRARPFGYVVKPFTGRELKTAIEVALVRHRMERELEAEGARLSERVKEQSCLYDVLRILHAADRSLEDRLQDVVERLPEGWQHPEVTEARLELDGQSHRTEGFRDTPWTLEEAIVLDGEQVGRITVCYLEDRASGDTGPFLVEEEQLLAAVAERVAHEVDRHRIRRRAERLADIVQTTSDFVGMATADGRVLWVNRRGRELLGISVDEPLEGTPITEFSPDWASRKITEEGLPAARELGLWEGETALRRRDGTEVPTSQVIIAHRNDSGEVSYFSTIARDISERKRFESELEYRALHDYLTDLPNRALFRDRLEHALERCDRTGEAIAVLFLDLRRFKMVNDSLGHDAGDRVLVEVARRLRQAIRDQDTLARMGGDEYTVLLEGLRDGQPEACEVAERVAECFAPSIELSDSTEIRVDASIGISVYDPEEDVVVSGTDLIRAADSAMYRSRQLSGTQFSVAAPSEEPDRSERFEREQRLRRAVDQGTLGTAYQPIYSLATGDLLAVEALARWSDPELGTVSPAEFIPLAEEAGFIVSLGEQQLERACREIQTLETPEGESPLCLHVNLSTRQLENPGVVERFSQVLERSGFPLSRLCLEITESAAMRRPHTVRNLAREGLMLAVDDFGTRHSTLSRLRELPVDILKIDRSFVAGLPENRKDRALVETILTLGRTLGLQVVAEGVEDESQVELLRDLGCHQAQGFHLGRPQGLEDIRSLISRESD